MAIIIGGGGAISNWDYEGVMTVGDAGFGDIYGWGYGAGSIDPTNPQVEGLPEVGTISWQGGTTLVVWDTDYTNKAANVIEIDGTEYELDAGGSYSTSVNPFAPVGETSVIKLK